MFTHKMRKRVLVFSKKDPGRFLNLANRSLAQGEEEQERGQGVAGRSRRRTRGGGTGSGDRGEPLGRLGEVWVGRRRLVSGEQRSPAEMLVDDSAPVVDWQEGGASELLLNKAKLLGWLGGA